MRVESLTEASAQPLLDECASLESLAYRFGRTYDAYFAVEPRRVEFRSRDGRGAVAWLQQGRYLHISGGLLAADQDKAALLDEVRQYAESHGLKLLFYNIAERDLPWFQAASFQVTRWGEEALVDLRDCDWSTPPYAWVRRQSSFCQRHHLGVRELDIRAITTPAHDPILQQIAELAHQQRAGRSSAGEIQFLEASFDPRRLHRQRVFVAAHRDSPEQVDGFLVCNPGRDGRLWSFETFRQRASAPRGTVAFVFHQAMQIMQCEGIPEVTLGLIPGQGVEQPLHHDSPLVRRALSWGTRHSESLFDTAGLLHFKSRFRPRFESRFLCARPGVTLRTALSFVRVLGVLRWPFAKRHATEPSMPSRVFYAKS